MKNAFLSRGRGQDCVLSHSRNTLLSFLFLTAQSTRFRILRVHYVKTEFNCVVFCVTFYFKVNLKNQHYLCWKKSIPVDIRLVHGNRILSRKYSWLLLTEKWLKKWNLLTFSLLIFITVLSKSLKRSNKFLDLNREPNLIWNLYIYI